MLVGYSVNTPWYLVYNKQTGRVITTKHFRFDESFWGSRFSTVIGDGVDKEMSNTLDKGKD